MQHQKTVFVVLFFVVIAIVLVLIILVLSKNNTDNNYNNRADIPAVDNITDWRPSMTSDGKYEKVYIDEDEAQRILMIHFNEDRLANPLFLCPIEKQFDLNSASEIIMFTPNPTVIEDALPDSVKNKLRYYEYKHLPELFSGLPIEDIYLSGEYKYNEKNANVILTDLIRLAAGYKYGGVYMDLDIIPKSKPVEDSYSSYVVSEDDITIVSGYFRFPRKSPLLWLIMERVVYHHPDTWGSFGPHAVTYTLKNSCGIRYDGDTGQWTEPNLNTDAECANVVILPTDSLFPIHYSQAGLYREDIDSVPSDVKEKIDKAFAIHWWNGGATKRPCLGENSLLANIARASCPKVYEKHKYSIIC